jgi:hypothetical protein
MRTAPGAAPYNVPMPPITVISWIESAMIPNGIDADGPLQRSTNASIASAGVAIIASATLASV